jgi:hypothetical protein
MILVSSKSIKIKKRKYCLFQSKIVDQIQCIICFLNDIVYIKSILS